GDASAPYDRAHRAAPRGRGTSGNSVPAGNGRLASFGVVQEPEQLAHERPRLLQGREVPGAWDRLVAAARQGLGHPLGAFVEVALVARARGAQRRDLEF